MKGNEIKKDSVVLSEYQRIITNISDKLEEDREDNDGE